MTLISATLLTRLGVGVVPLPDRISVDVRSSSAPLITWGFVSSISVGLHAVIAAVTSDRPLILLVNGDVPALPAGHLRDTDETLELALRRSIATETDLEVGYAEQLYTFGDLHRGGGAARELSVAYLALVRQQVPSGNAEWRSWYEFFPWEDHRLGRPTVVDELVRRLVEWASSGSDPETALERIDIAFGRSGATWDGVRALERYELLYEAGLVAEAYTDHGRDEPRDLPRSMAMVSDHRRIAATALGRIRGKITYRPVVFELLPERFTLLQLQRVVEALAGVRLHKQNFRRLVERAGLVEGTGRMDTGSMGRPAELFRFRRGVLRERPRPGVGLPGIRG